MSGKLQLLLLCGSCLCLRGAPIQLPNTSLSLSKSSTARRLPTTNGRETALQGDQLTETENWDTSGTLEPEKDVQEAQSREARIDGLPGEPEPWGTPEVPTRRSTSASPQLQRQKRKQSGAPGFSQSENQETSSPSSADGGQFWTQKQTVSSPSLMSDTSQMFTPLTGCEGGTVSSSSDPLSDEGPMCRQERRQVGTATPAAVSEEEDGATKATGTSLPIEPFKVQETHRMGFHQPPDDMTTSGLLLSKINHLVTGQADSAEATWNRSTLLPDQIPPQQTSGDDLEPVEPVSSSSPPLLQVETELEHQLETEEQEEDENSEESEEEDSEEDLTERFTESPYGHIPPPPLWVQGNQGLMRSWLELIKEKAGHVSGMLVPVGIGITGALMIVGVLYSIRMVYRRRRDNFKELRRKVRQPEHLHERGSSVQDQAMLLVNSSEDEF